MTWRTRFSSASTGARVPLIGKLDIGPSAEGFVRCVQEVLPPARRGNVTYVPIQLADGYEVTACDAQVGCR